jgi:hypothetical protein
MREGCGCYRILNTFQSALRLESGFLEASQIIFGLRATANAAGKATSRKPEDANHIDQWLPPKDGEPVF